MAYNGQTFKVLDHGYVELIDSMGDDESIVEAARMSTDRGFVSWEPYERCRNCDAAFSTAIGSEGKCLAPGGDEGSWAESPCCAKPDMEKFPRGDFGLLDALYRNNHATPFEMCELVIEVQAPIFVFREWHRHRTQAVLDDDTVFSFNEFSARYSQMPNLHYVPAVDRICKQSRKNKQGSGAPVDVGVAARVRAKIVEQQADLYDTYDVWVNQDEIAKEIARVNTPVSRYSKQRAKANLRNWFGFLKLRDDGPAQYEIREYAKVVGQIVKELWPKSWSLFEEYDKYGMRLSRTEAVALRDQLTELQRCGGTLPPALNALLHRTMERLAA